MQASWPRRKQNPSEEARDPINVYAPFFLLPYPPVVAYNETRSIRPRMQKKTLSRLVVTSSFLFPDADSVRCLFLSCFASTDTLHGRMDLYLDKSKDILDQDGRAAFCKFSQAQTEEILRIQIQNKMCPVYRRTFWTNSDSEASPEAKNPRSSFAAAASIIFAIREKRISVWAGARLSFSAPVRQEPGETAVAWGVISTSGNRGNGEEGEVEPISQQEQ